MKIIFRVIVPVLAAFVLSGCDMTPVQQRQNASAWLDGTWNCAHIGGGDTMVIKDGIVSYTWRFCTPPFSKTFEGIVPRTTGDVVEVGLPIATSDFLISTGKRC